MDASYFRTLYDHLYWARDRVLAAAEGMSEAEYAKPNGFTYKSVRGILTHCLSGETIWLARALGQPPEPVQEADVPTPAALSERWRAHEAKMRPFLDRLTDETVAGNVTFRARDGSDRTLPVWQLLTLVYHHTVQHRSEAAEALSMVGRSPGDMDFLVYMNAAASGRR
jgi:uncharacterized damage-inducible protein DinB